MVTHEWCGGLLSDCCPAFLASHGFDVSDYFGRLKISLAAHINPELSYRNSIQKRFE